MITPYKRFSPRNLEFGKPMPRGVFQFINITYKGEPLVIETPPLITPNGMNADDARYWMDVELNVASDQNHQTLYDVFKSTDDYCIKECIRNLGKWFKGVDESFIEEEYKSPITAGWGNEPASLRVEVVSERPEDLIDSDGIPIQPTDVTSLSAVTVQMQLLGIWASERYIGCHWRALAIKANLDHEKNGRRQSESPRHISPLPRPVEKKPEQQSKAPTGTTAPTVPAAGQKAPSASKVVAPQTNRSAKVQEMLNNLKEKNEARKKQLESVKPASGPSEQRSQAEEEFDAEEYERRLEGDEYSDDERRRSSERYDDRRGDDRRRYSDRSDGYSDDDRRRYSDGYSDDERRRSDDRSDGYSDDERRRSPDYSEKRSNSDDRRHQEHNNYYSGRSRYH